MIIFKCIVKMSEDLFFQKQKYLPEGMTNLVNYVSMHQVFSVIVKEVSKFSSIMIEINQYGYALTEIRHHFEKITVR